MTINSRNKGAAYERAIASRLEGPTGIRFRRNLEQVRAVDHCDLIADDADWPFSLELKRYAAGTTCKPAWQEQATRAADKTGKIPVVIYQFDRRDTRVSVPLSSIGMALGQVWSEPEWAEITIEALAYLAGELMAKEDAAQ